MDDRDEDDFRKDIAQFTEKEMIYGKAMREEFSARGRPCVVGESGVDNTGAIIYGKLPNFNPDKIYTFKDASWIYMEIKTIPESHNKFHTFKVSALKGCLEYEAFILVPKLNYYFIYGAAAMRLMLERCDVVPFFGGKPCVQPSMTFIKHMESEGLIIRREWTPKARKFIDGFKSILAADRISNMRNAS